MNLTVFRAGVSNFFPIFPKLLSKKQLNFSLFIFQQILAIFVLEILVSGLVSSMYIEVQNDGVFRHDSCCAKEVSVTYPPLGTNKLGNFVHLHTSEHFSQRIVQTFCPPQTLANHPDMRCRAGTCVNSIEFQDVLIDGNVRGNTIVQHSVIAVERCKYVAL